jgi:hypothetical protein
MNWELILKAENWEFVYLNDVGWYAQFRAPDTIIINLGFIYHQIVTILNELIQDYGPGVEISHNNMDVIFNSPNVGPLVEQFIIEEIIHNINHEVLHEANYLTDLKKEVLEKLGKEGKNPFNTVWNAYIGRFYDELFVRLLNGDNYEKALTDTATYLDSWVVDFIQGLTEQNLLVTIVGEAIATRITKEFIALGKTLVNYLELRQDMFIKKLEVLFEKESSEELLQEILQVMENAQPLSEGWKKIISDTKERIE